MLNIKLLENEKLSVTDSDTGKIFETYNGGETWTLIKE